MSVERIFELGRHLTERDRATKTRPQRLRRRTHSAGQARSRRPPPTRNIYRDGSLIHDALEAAAAKRRETQPALEEQRRTIADEARRAERALARYYTAFEKGDLDANRFDKRESGLETRLDTLREEDAQLSQQLAPEAATSPDAADLAAVADNLETTIATAEPRQANALLRLLIKELRVNARSEMLPTYRIVTPAVCALPSSVE